MDEEEVERGSVGRLCGKEMLHNQLPFFPAFLCHPYLCLPRRLALRALLIFIFILSITSLIFTLFSFFLLLSVTHLAAQAQALEVSSSSICLLNDKRSSHLLSLSKCVSAATETKCLNEETVIIRLFFFKKFVLPFAFILGIISRQTHKQNMI